MIGTLIGIIFTVIVLGVLFWACQTLLPLIPMAEPFRTILYVLMVLIMVFVVLWIIWQLIGASGILSASFSPLSLHSR